MRGIAFALVLSVPLWAGIVVGAVKVQALAARGELFALSWGPR